MALSIESVDILHLYRENYTQIKRIYPQAPLPRRLLASSDEELNELAQAIEYTHPRLSMLLELLVDKKEKDMV